MWGLLDWLDCFGWLVNMHFLRWWRVRPDCVSVSQNSMASIVSDIDRCRTSCSAAKEPVWFTTQTARTQELTYRNGLDAVLMHPFRDLPYAPIFAPHVLPTLLSNLAEFPSLHHSPPRLDVLKQPNISENQPHRHEKPNPDFPPHARLLSHPQHAVHSPSQPHACVVKRVVHVVSEGGRGADLVADGDGDLR